MISNMKCESLVPSHPWWWSHQEAKHYKWENTEHSANKDSLLIKTSTTQPGGRWWVVCHSPVQRQLMGTTQHLPRGDFREYQKQVLQAACLHIKVAFPDYVSCVTHSFSWGRVTDGGGMVTSDCMVQPGKVNWKGESLHPSALPPEPQMLSWGGDVEIPISKQTGGASKEPGVPLP